MISMQNFIYKNYKYIGNMTKMATMPIYSKNLLKSPEPEDLVFSIGDVGPIKFVQMILS